MEARIVKTRLQHGHIKADEIGNNVQRWFQRTGNGMTTVAPVQLEI